MSAPDLRAVLDRFMATWHTHDVNAIKLMFAPSFEYSAAAMRVPSADAMMAFAQGIWSGTPDEHCEAVSVLVDGNRLCAEVRTTGTHSGPMRFGDILLPATGRRTEIMSVWIFTFEGERILRWNEYGNVKDWVEQMGATVTITPAAGG